MALIDLVTVNTSTNEAPKESIIRKLKFKTKSKLIQTLNLPTEEDLKAVEKARASNPEEENAITAAPKTSLDVLTKLTQQVGESLGVQQDLLNVLAPLAAQAFKATQSPLLGMIAGGLIEKGYKQEVAQKQKLIRKIENVFTTLQKTAEATIPLLTSTFEFIKGHVVTVTSHFITSVDDFFANVLTSTGPLAPLMKIIYPYLKSIVVTTVKSVWSASKSIIGKTLSTLYKYTLAKFLKPKGVEKLDKITNQVTGMTNLLSVISKGISQLEEVGIEVPSLLKNIVSTLETGFTDPTKLMSQVLDKIEMSNKETVAKQATLFKKMLASKKVQVGLVAGSAVLMATVPEAKKEKIVPEREKVIKSFKESAEKTQEFVKTLVFSKEKPKKEKKQSTYSDKEGKAEKDREKREREQEHKAILSLPGIFSAVNLKMSKLFSSVKTIFSSVKEGFLKLASIGINLVTTALKNPLVTGSILVGTAISNWDEFTSSLKFTSFAATVTKFVEKLPSIMGMFKSIGSVITSMTQFFPKLAPVIEMAGVAGASISIVAKALPILSKIGSVIGPIFSVASKIFSFIPGPIQWAMWAWTAIDVIGWDNIKKGIGFVWDVGKWIFKAIGTIVTTVWDGIVGLKNIIVKSVKFLWKNMKGIAEFIANPFLTLGNILWQGIKKVPDLIHNIFKKIKHGILKLLDKFVGWIPGLHEKIQGILKFDEEIDKVVSEVPTKKSKPKSIETLEEKGFVHKTWFGNDEINRKEIIEGLNTGVITKEDLKQILKELKLSNIDKAFLLKLVKQKQPINQEVKNTSIIQELIKERKLYKTESGKYTISPQYREILDIIEPKELVALNTIKNLEPSAKREVQRVIQERHLDIQVENIDNDLEKIAEDVVSQLHLKSKTDILINHRILNNVAQFSVKILDSKTKKPIFGDVISVEVDQLPQLDKELKQALKKHEYNILKKYKNSKILDQLTQKTEVPAQINMNIVTPTRIKSHLDYTGFRGTLSRTQTETQQYTSPTIQNSGSYKQLPKTILGKYLITSPISQGRITSYFGPRYHPILKTMKFHNGVDIGAPLGTPIQAAGKGYVDFSGMKDGYGNVVIIDHGYGYKTLYAHMHEIHVDKGQVVKQGDIIGTVGSTGRSTGPHLHFTVYLNNRPVDPLSIINKVPANGKEIPSVIEEHTQQNITNQVQPQSLKTRANTQTLQNKKLFKKIGENVIQFPVYIPGAQSENMNPNVSKPSIPKPLKEQRNVPSIAEAVNQNLTEAKSKEEQVRSKQNTELATHIAKGVAHTVPSALEKTVARPVTQTLKTVAAVASNTNNNIVSNAVNSTNVTTVNSTTKTVVVQQPQKFQDVTF